MYDRPDSLFSGPSVFELTNQVPVHAMAALKGYDENKILSMPADDLVAENCQKHRLYIPVLNTQETWIEEKEITQIVNHAGYDIYEDRFGSRESVVHIVIFHLPFSGDGSLFKIGPSSRSVPGPQANVGNQELSIALATLDKSHDQIRAEYDQRVQDIQRHLMTLSRDVASLPVQIEAQARTYVEQRKAQLLKSKNLVASLGFPMRRRPDVPATFHAPEVRRKIMPVRPQTIPPFKPEPALDEAEYQHILSVMDNMTRVMERSPKTFHNMGEEDIRQHFLVQLNGHYDGQATGETFNFQGKTDILIRSDGRNIFIAECKFWHGEKAFLETIDQLLSYLSWRDSKTALVIFNRNKNFSAVIGAIKGAMDMHPQRKDGPTVEGETRLRYKMGYPADHSREIIVTVMAYDIPTPF
ncbi:hypothetical protein [Lichenihabitans psoromatis]|uniref:hypothetical protein n=1 Tax=Lichenihabitans psoromatis TaxID=2528642 RepID=UPI001036996B|nr:hypothetical protein [Lichenihabitans psoromatis]